MPVISRMDLPLAKAVTTRNGSNISVRTYLRRKINDSTDVIALGVEDTKVSGGSGTGVETPVQPVKTMVKQLCPCSPWKTTGMQRSTHSPWRRPLSEQVDA
ncbi:hypothetical protein HGM15179_000526 [Zosterops borbonicus]|uniref:Uncharacterized protein n=1 Tax=Zosterops borbonicus TaxID=364589 RepID=A0A8K1LTT1_9PASS|nr:hypothetical protein HGM15179_000526 [Zosterops borbonicus]